MFNGSIEVLFRNMKSLQHATSTKRVSRGLTGVVQLRWGLLVGALISLSAVVIVNVLERTPSTKFIHQSQQSRLISEEALKISSYSYDATKTLDRTAPIDAIGNLNFLGTGGVYLNNYRGELLLTRDAGKSWAPIGGDVTKRFDAFTIIDDYRGWAVDNKGHVLKTADGGHTWDTTSALRRRDPEEHYMSASQILFSDENKGWIVDVFAVWHTRDAGLSWDEVGEFPCRELINQLRELKFIDSRRGWARCDQSVFITTDGGSTWRSAVDLLGFDDLTSINAAHFLDENLGWISVSDSPKYPANVVLSTKDGGKTWQPQKEVGSRVIVYDVFFVGGELGWMAGGKRSTGSETETGVLFRTQDGGRTWQSVETAPDDDSIKYVHFTSADEGWIVTGYSVHRTHDGGQTWTNVLSYPEVKRRNMRILGLESAEGEAPQGEAKIIR